MLGNVLPKKSTILVPKSHLMVFVCIVSGSAIGIAGQGGSLIESMCGALFYSALLLVYIFIAAFVHDRLASTVSLALLICVGVAQVKITSSLSPAPPTQALWWMMWLWQVILILVLIAQSVLIGMVRIFTK